MRWSVLRVHVPVVDVCRIGMTFPALLPLQEKQLPGLSLKSCITVLCLQGMHRTPSSSVTSMGPCLALVFALKFVKWATVCADLAGSSIYYFGHE